MFGFSIPKLIVLAAIIAAVWYGFKWVGRYQKLQRVKEKARQREDRIDAAEMVACAVCGTFVVEAEAADCGRDDCPYP